MTDNTETWIVVAYDIWIAIKFLFQYVLCLISGIYIGEIDKDK